MKYQVIKLTDNDSKKKAFFIEVHKKMQKNMAIFYSNNILEMNLFIFEFNCASSFTKRNEGC
jgi:hypothetical protein